MNRDLQIKIIIAFATIYLIWGSTYLAIKFGVESIPPFMMIGTRFLIAGAAFILIARFRGAVIPNIRDWKNTIIIGTLMIMGGTGLVTWAELYVPSGLTALLVAMVPLWVVLVNWLRPNGIKPTGKIIFGLLLGFAGVILLINPTDMGQIAEIDLIGAVAIVGATFFWACGSVYSRIAKQPDSQWLSTGMQMFSGGVVLFLFSFITGEFGRLDVNAITLKSALSLGYLTLFGSVAFAAYLWLIKASTPARAATYAYVNPLIALLLGNLLADEPISLWTISCSVLIITAVALVVSSKISKQEMKNSDEIDEISENLSIERCRTCDG